MTPQSLPETGGESVQPIKNRIAFLDVLRAFALLGIYISIIHSFNGSALYGNEAVASSLDHWVGRLESLLINKRFIGILSLLFGVGIAIQQKNFQQKNTPFTGYFLKRMAILGCFGLINTTFYFNGEILLVYAILGVVTLAMSRLEPKAIVLFAAFIYLIPAQIFEVTARDRLIEWFQWFPDAYSAERVKEIYTGTDFTQMVRLRWTEYAYIYTDNNFHLAMSLAMILWGYVIGTKGYHMKLIDEPMRFALPFAFALVYTFFFTLFGLFTGQTDIIFAYNPIGYVFYAIFMLTSMFVYIYLVLLAFLLLGKENAVMKVAANNGRLCLTGYMGGALVYSFIFYGIGLGWYMKYSTTELVGIALVTYLLFTIAAQLWTKRFNQGPMEWLFRRLSYATH